MKSATVVVATTVAVGAAALLWERRRRRILRETIACRLAALAADGRLHEAALTHCSARKPLMKSLSIAPGTDVSPRTRAAIATLASPAPPRPDFESVADDKEAEPVTVDNDDTSLHETYRALKERNRTVAKSYERREVARARARADELNARAEAEAAAGVESFAERSRKMLELRRQREAEEAENAPPASPSTPEPASAAPPALPGATEASVAAELKRWPSPPAGSVTTLEPHVWPLYHDHFAWLDEVAPRYAFADAGEALRHLVFAANAETPQIKKLIFLSIRCGHCHAGAGSAGGGIPKKDKALDVFGFQMQWLRAVQQRSGHPTVEKTVRIVCDYYRRMTSDSARAEAELFWRSRENVPVSKTMKRV